MLLLLIQLLGMGGSGNGSVVGDSTNLPTLFLADATPVPVTAMFLGGAAYAPSGERYVALWPTSGVVFYIGGLAHRTDGALCINPVGAEFMDLRGLSVTNRGEVITSLTIRDLVHDDFPLLYSGALCVIQQS